ncbi:MAG: hypothetical protein HQ546_04200 [Planctomycetes bacterium]|nr:hypothetical protein [Planctomycetota bacterium]
MKSRFGILTYLALTLLSVMLATTGCKKSGSGDSKASEGYGAMTYRSQQGGCILYCRNAGDVTMLSDLESPIGVTGPGGKVDIPACSSWGVIVLTGGLSDMVAEWNDNRVPELMILDDQGHPRITDEELAALPSIKSIKRLDLSFCPLITDGAFEHIKKMDNLRILFLPAKSQVTEKGFLEIQQLRPNLQVTRAACDNLKDSLKR